MDPALPNYEVAAVRYATRGGQRRDHFLGGDPHESPMPMDYYVWFIRGAGRTIVVDTGFDEAMARQRKRQRLPKLPIALPLLQPFARHVERQQRLSVFIRVTGNLAVPLHR